MNEIAPEASKYFNTFELWQSTSATHLCSPSAHFQRLFLCLSLSPVNWACFLLRRLEDKGAPEQSAKIWDSHQRWQKTFSPRKILHSFLTSVDTHFIKAQCLAVISKAFWFCFYCLPVRSIRIFPPTSSLHKTCCFSDKTLFCCWPVTSQHKT